MNWFCNFDDARLLTKLSQLESKIDQLLKLGVKIMPVLTDLQTSVANLSKAVSDATEEITSLLDRIVADETPDAEVKQAAEQIQSIVDGLTSAVAAAKVKAGTP
jgi:uncharacterized protein involved in exopolysaccharide biosynthesis